MDLIAQLAHELSLKAANVEEAVKLNDEGTSFCSSSPRAILRPSSNSRFARPRSSSVSRTSTSPTAKSA